MTPIAPGGRRAVGITRAPEQARGIAQALAQAPGIAQAPEHD
ncbi:hypothetical protein [Streptomyces panaciradicis]|nr:hypothetical protein [Streptomyces panaciradicis]